MEEFFEQLHDGQKATYGFEATRQNLMMGAVDRLLISEDLRKDVVVYDCGGREEFEVVDRRADTPSHTCEDGTEGEVQEREDVIDHLMDLAEQRGSDAKFISTDFEKGEQLLTAFGGIAGILRYSTGV
jgi:peptide chain release factor subunit 1